MGFLARFFGIGDKDEPEIYDEDEEEELLAESELYTDAQPLINTSFKIYPKDIYNLDTDALLEHLTDLPYEFRYYLDTRRAFSKGLKACRDEISDLTSYEGGRSAEYTVGFDYDGIDVSIKFTLSKESDGAPFVFSGEVTTE